jgi:hypothetical protein
VKNTKEWDGKTEENRFIWTICLDINYIQQQFLKHQGHFKGNKKFPQNVLHFYFIKYGKPANTPVFIQHRTNITAMACPFSWKIAYLQTIQTGSYLNKASVTDKCIISYKSDN